MQVFEQLSLAAKFVDSLAVTPISTETGIPKDQLRLFFMWFVAFPVGWFLHFCVRGTILRHTINIVLGVLSMSYFFGWETIHVVLMSGVSWLLMAYAPRDQQQKYVCAYVFTYLSFSHINTVLYHFDSYDLEITT